ncbi:hypothetical protein Bbelb_315140 [Branchiostoma belcheri]|nr:hypothetical protein Bbelb_315140 [Branchiostoma belcheri]
MLLYLTENCTQSRLMNTVVTPHTSLVAPSESPGNCVRTSVKHTMCPPAKVAAFGSRFLRARKRRVKRQRCWFAKPSVEPTAGSDRCELMPIPDIAISAASFPAMICSEAYLRKTFLPPDGDL